MTDRAEHRANILQHLEAGRLSETDAREHLDVGNRHLRRLRTTLREDGIKGLVHGNQGRLPANALAVETRSRIEELARQPRYLEINHSYFTELLASEEGIFVSTSTATRILQAAGIKPPRQKRRKKCFRRRTPRRCAGMLVQMDGSDHRWVEHLPEFTIVAGVDDATGRLWAVIRPTEDARGYFDLFRAIVTDVGLPEAVYTDQHSIFGPSRKYKKQDVLGKPLNLSQLQRALSEVKVRHIKANTPQAKGRIERNFDTLQDRLVSWFRYEEITTMEAAHRSLARYLVQHNRRFTRLAADPALAWRPWPRDQALDDVLCFKHTRKVRNDNTIRFAAAAIDLPPGPRNSSYARHHVTVLQAFDGTLRVVRDRHVLAVVVPTELVRLTTSRKPGQLPSRAHRSAQRHGRSRLHQQTTAKAPKPSYSRQSAVNRPRTESLKN